MTDAPRPPEPSDDVSAAPPEAVVGDDPDIRGDVDERWRLHLAGPLLMWLVAAVTLSHSGPSIMSLLHDVALASAPEEQAAFLARHYMSLFMLSFFVGLTGVYCVLAAGNGMFPRSALLLAIGALVLNFSLSIAHFAAFGFAPRGDLALVNTTLMLLAAPVFGELLSRAFKRREYLVPAMLVAALADVWSVIFGPSRIIAETPEALSSVAVAYPTGGLEGLPSFAPSVGVMDWVFVSFLVAFVHRFGLRRWYLIPALVLGLGAGIAMLKAFFLPLPYLVTIGVGFVLCYYPEVRPKKKDMQITLAFIGVMAVVFGGIAWMRSGAEAERPSLMRTETEGGGSATLPLDEPDADLRIDEEGMPE